MQLKIFLVGLLISCTLMAQQEQEIEKYIDSIYLEDQFYFGLLYNFNMTNNNNIESSGVPFCVKTGFIKDIPLNKKRNKALGLGVGYNFDVVRPNIVIQNQNQGLIFNVDNSDQSTNYASHEIEFPLEFRWRTSTATNDSFWRIYTGVSFVKILKSTASFKNSAVNTTTFKDIPAINRNKYTLYTSVGFGTWNLYVKYYLNRFFDNNIDREKEENINFNQLKVGVMMYLL